MGAPIFTRYRHGRSDLAALAAFAHGPVADTPEPLAAEAGRPIPEPDGNHLDAMGHE
jgi:hypothetical protein